MGIRSIICLLADDQLNLYDDVPGGLLSHYRAAGFTVEHVPARDHQHPPLTRQHLDEIWRAYESLPKPILVHAAPASIAPDGPSTISVVSSASPHEGSNFAVHRTGGLRMAA